mgnify:CR=1 FL=1
MRAKVCDGNGLKYCESLGEWGVTGMSSATLPLGARVGESAELANFNCTATELVDALLEENMAKTAAGSYLMGVVENLRRCIRNLLCSLTAGERFDLAVIDRQTETVFKDDLEALLGEFEEQPEPRESVASLQGLYDELLHRMSRNLEKSKFNQQQLVRLPPLNSQSRRSSAQIVRGLLHSASSRITQQGESLLLEFNTTERKLLHKITSVFKEENIARVSHSQRSKRSPISTFANEKRKPKFETFQMLTEAENNSSKISSERSLSEKRQAKKGSVTRDDTLTPLYLMIRKAVEEGMCSFHLKAANSFKEDSKTAPQSPRVRAQSSTVSEMQDLRQQDLRCSEEEICTQSPSSHRDSDISADLSQTDSARSAAVHRQLNAIDLQCDSCTESVEVKKRSLTEDEARAEVLNARTLEQIWGHISTIYLSFFGLLTNNYANMLKKYEPQRYARIKPVMKKHYQLILAENRLSDVQGKKQTKNALKTLAKVLKSDSDKWRAFVKEMAV